MPKLAVDNLVGEVVIPPSKSLAHRAIIASSLADSPSIIKNVSYSKDILATISCLRSLGIEIVTFANSLKVIPHPLKRVSDLNACESGSTLRFMIPLMLLQDEEIKIDGINRLKTRPINDYLNIFADFKIKYEYNNELPLTVKGRLKAGKYYLKGDTSSQFLTGLMLALPLLEGDSEIILTSNLESIEYVNMTIKILDLYGIKILKTAKGYYIKGSQKYQSHDYVIPADFSQAAFFLVANFLGAKIKLKGLELNHLQGDERIISILEEMGASFDSDYLVTSLEPKNIDISLKDEPDLLPILAVAALAIPGETIFRDLKRLEYKESNRILATKELIEAVGGKVEVRDYAMCVSKGNDLRPNRVKVYNDHRILMAAAILNLLTKEITVDDLKPVNKSFPDFFKIYEALGGKIYEWAWKGKNGNW